MNLIKYFLFTCLTITTAQTQAALIKASDFEVGTEITQLNDNATISWLRGNGYGQTTETLPVSIQLSQSFHGSTKSFIGATHDIWGLTAPVSGLIKSLDDIYAAQRSFSGILITYATPTRQLTANWLDPYGDGIVVSTFDKNGDFLGWKTGSPSINGYTPKKREERCFSENYCGTAHGGTFHFNSDVSYILIGGQDASLYIESLDASLPEPSLLYLLALAGIGLALSGLRHDRKNLVT